MKQAIVQGKALWEAYRNMQDEHQVVITTVDPNLKTLIHWVERVYNRFVEKVSGRSLYVIERLQERVHEHNIDDIIRTMSQRKLQ